MDRSRFPSPCSAIDCCVVDTVPGGCGHQFTELFQLISLRGLRGRGRDSLCGTGQDSSTAVSAPISRWVSHSEMYPVRVTESAVRLGLPDWAWRRPEVRRALRERDVATLLRAAQQYSGASQGRIAAATGLLQGRVSEIIHRARTVTTLELFERIAHGLACPMTPECCSVSRRVTPLGWTTSVRRAARRSSRCIRRSHRR